MAEPRRAYVTYALSLYTPPPKWTTLRPGRSAHVIKHGNSGDVCSWVPSARSRSPFPLAKAALSAFREALEPTLLGTAVSQPLSSPPPSSLPHPHECPPPLPPWPCPFVISPCACPISPNDAGSGNSWLSSHLCSRLQPAHSRPPALWGES